MNLPWLARFREEISAVHCLTDRGLGKLDFRKDNKDKPN